MRATPEAVSSPAGLLDFSPFVVCGFLGSHQPRLVKCLYILYPKRYLRRLLFAFQRSVFQIENLLSFRLASVLLLFLRLSVQLSLFTCLRLLHLSLSLSPCVWVSVWGKALCVCLFTSPLSPTLTVCVCLCVCVRACACFLSA